MIASHVTSSLVSDGVFLDQTGYTSEDHRMHSWLGKAGLSKSGEIERPRQSSDQETRSFSQLAGHFSDSGARNGIPLCSLWRDGPLKHGGIPATDRFISGIGVAHGPATMG